MARHLIPISLQPLGVLGHLSNRKAEIWERLMKAKAAIVSVFALVLAAAAVCGEQYRLKTEAATNDHATLDAVHVVAQEVDVTN